MRDFILVAPFLVWRPPAYHMQAKGAATFNSSVQQIPGHPPVESSTSVYVVTLAVGLLLLLLALALWFFPLTVAKALIPSSSKTDYVKVPLEQAQSVGFTLLGLWVLASAIPDSFYWLFMLYQASVPELKFELGTRHYASVVSTAVRLILGIWILFGARGLLGVLRWARSAGT